MIQKINTKTNVLTWFEIPIKNMERAQAFYEKVLDIKMETLKGQKEETVFFPAFTRHHYGAIRYFIRRTCEIRTIKTFY